MKKGLIFLFIVLVGTFTYLRFQPSKDATWQSKESSILVYEVSSKAKKIAESMYDRLDRLETLGAPRIFTYGKNRIVIQLPPLQGELNNKIKRYLSFTSLQLCLVAAPSVGFGLDEKSEREIYQKKKMEGNINSYTANLYEKGYAWFPSKKGVERLLWVRDGYSITQESFSEMSYDEKQGNVSFSMKPQSTQDFAELTKNYQREYLAIVFNNIIFATPMISSEISHGRGVLEGFSKKESMMLLQMHDTISLSEEPTLLNEMGLHPLHGTQQKYGFFTYISLKKEAEMPKSTLLEVRKIKNLNDDSKDKHKYMVIGNIENADFHEEYNKLNNMRHKIKKSENKLKLLEKEGIRLLEKTSRQRKLISESRRNLEELEKLRGEFHKCKGELKQKQQKITNAKKDFINNNEEYAALFESIKNTYQKDFQQNVQTAFPSNIIEEDSFSTIGLMQDIK